MALLFRYVGVYLFQDHTVCEVSAVPRRKQKQRIFQGSWMATTKILLVDDDEMLNKTMRSLLEREGFDVPVADS
jgi:PleD family two-component response regulator